MAIEVKAATPTQVVIKLASQNQQKLRDVSIQIASGNKHETFKGFAEDGTVERFISFHETLDSTDAYLASNQIIQARVNTMDLAIGQIQDIAADVAQLIAKRRNSASGTDVALKLQADAMLNDISGKLNIKFDGRYLFSGTKTDTKPVPQVSVTNLDNNNAATNTYYSGDSIRPSVKINDSQSLEYGVTGDEKGFQELIGALHLAIKGDAADDDAILASAVNMIDSAVANIASARTIVVSARNTINEADAVHRDVNILISENLIEISQTDIVEATTKMSELEATVQATFLAFSRLNELRLSNFL